MSATHIEVVTTGGGDVAAARKLSKKQSFTGMPFDDVFCLNKEQAVKLLSHGGLNAKDTEAALQEMDTDGDGQFQASEIGSQIGRLLKKAHAQDTVIKRLNKAVLFLGALLALSVCANFGVSFVAVELSRNTDVDEDTNAGTRKGELLVKDGDGHAVVKVSETVVDIKMLLTPALPYDMLERIKTVEYISDRTMHDVAVAGYSYVSESSFTLHLETGGKLQMDGMAVFETKPDGSGPFELPASALAGQLVNESRCFDNEALYQIYAVMPEDCASRLAFAPQAAGMEDRAANKTTILSRLGDVYISHREDCCTDCAMACTDHCAQLLEDMLTIVRDEYDDDVWLHAAAARKKDSLTPGVFNRRQDTGRFDITTEYWTWGGSNNNLNTKGTPGRDICVRAMELSSPSSMGGMVEVGEGAYNSLEDKHLDIEDLWHMEGDVDWVKCRKAFQDGELQCPPDAIKQIRTITG